MWTGSQRWVREDLSQCYTTFLILHLLILLTTLGSFHKSLDHGGLRVRGAVTMPQLTMLVVCSGSLWWSVGVVVSYRVMVVC